MIHRLAVCLAAAVSLAPAGDQPQWGRTFARNMVSDETGLPASFDPATGKNVKWRAALGTTCHATPVIARGKVLIGTNNDRPRDTRHQGDRGVLLCLNESDASLCWQLVVPKLKGDKFRDWPRIGIVSPPTVEGDRVYVPTNRGEILCLDLNGQADGNHGPFTSEGLFMVDGAAPAMDVGKTDADILWRFDTHAEVGSYPHDTAHCSILVHGPLLYANTGNGVDNTHRRIRCPEAPSLIVLDKATGRLVAKDHERMGPRIPHCTWSSPALAQVAGRPLILFAGGDGICYAFRPPEPEPEGEAVKGLAKAWWFDSDPAAPKEQVHRYAKNPQEGPSNINGMAVFHEGRVYVVAGGDPWWGKRQAWLKCIDASGSGDVTHTGQVWSYSMERQSCSSPAVHAGLVYIADCAGRLHCVDARTGSACWTHQLKGAVWGSTLVTDGKVYVGTRRKQFCVLAAGRHKRVLSTVQLDSPMTSTPAAANGVLYVATSRTLYALQSETTQTAGPPRH